MLLVIDTETTGLARFSYPDPIRAPDLWPRLVSVAWKRVAVGLTAPAQELIVKPIGFRIPAAAAAVHGVTQERALAEGVTLDAVHRALAAAVAQRQNGEPVVACCYNAPYDMGVLLSEAKRQGHARLLRLLGGFQWHCIMQEARVALGSRDFLKLEEAAKRLGIDTKGVVFHGAAADVEITASVLRKLAKMPK